MRRRYGTRARAGASAGRDPGRRSGALFERDLFRKPVRTFRDHAQYLSATKFRPFKDARSSYLPLPDRFDSTTFVRGTFLYGMRDKMWEMQLSRARRLSSERTTYQGACSLSVASNIMS